MTNKIEPVPTKQFRRFAARNRAAPVKFQDDEFLRAFARAFVILAQKSRDIGTIEELLKWHEKKFARFRA